MANIKHKVIIKGWDDNAVDKELEIAAYLEGISKDGADTVSFPQIGVTVNRRDLFDAIEYLRTRS